MSEPIFEMGHSKTIDPLVFVFKDTTNNCILEREDHYPAANIKSEKAINRWANGKLKSFISSIKEIL